MQAGISNAIHCGASATPSGRGTRQIRGIDRPLLATSDSAIICFLGTFGRQLAGIRDSCRSMHRHRPYRSVAKTNLLADLAPIRRIWERIRDASEAAYRIPAPYGSVPLFKRLGLSKADALPSPIVVDENNPSVFERSADGCLICQCSRDLPVNDFSPTDGCHSYL